MNPRSSALAGVCFVAAATMLWPAIGTLVTYWREINDYHHGYLIVAVSVAWLVLVARRRQPASAQLSAAGLVLLTLALIAWLVASRAHINIAQQLLVPPILWLTILATTGWTSARPFVAPVAYLVFAIPVWNYLLPVLQRMSVFASETLLGALGVAAVVSEHLVTIPEGTFNIVEGCSGLRYFMITLALASIAAALNHVRGRKLVILFAASAVFALLINWLRIVIVIYAGHVSNMTSYLVAKEHFTLGNVLFLPLLAAVLLLARRLGSASTETPANTSLSSPSQDGVAGVSPLTAVPTLLLLGLAAWLGAAGNAPLAVPGRLGQLPVALGDWQGPLPARSLWSPHYVASTDERRVTYGATSGATVDLYLNVYASQAQGRELAYYDNQLVAPQGWIREWPLVSQSMASGRGGSLETFQMRDPEGGVWVIAYTLKVGGWRTSREGLAQLAYGLLSIWKPVPAGLVAMAARCSENCEAARALVTAFWDDMSTPILAALPERNPDP